MSISTETEQPKKRRVLVVDNRCDWLLTLEQFYRSNGIDVVACLSVEEAQNQLQTEGITEVLTGTLRLGGKDRWREIYRSAGDIPVRLYGEDVSLEQDAVASGITFLDIRTCGPEAILQVPVKLTDTTE